MDATQNIAATAVDPEEEAEAGIRLLKEDETPGLSNVSG